MANPKEIHNIEPFPTTHRVVPPATQENHTTLEADDTSSLKKHSMTPVKAMKVEYWHQGEQPTQEWKMEKRIKKQYSPKREDQFSILLVVCAVLIVASVVITLLVTSKHNVTLTNKEKVISTAVVDFYQGNHTFSQKVAEEKAAKLDPGHQIHGISVVNEDLEVPLSEQMNSMSEKMKAMRSVKQVDEAAPPPRDQGASVGIAPIQPPKDANFQSPLEFNNALPKPLQPAP